VANYKVSTEYRIQRIMQQAKQNTYKEGKTKEKKKEKGSN
jgi:hypothetical protein